MSDYPKEFFVKINNEPYYQEARLTVNCTEVDFYTEIDIVQKESRKIFYHIGIIYKLDSEQEAIDVAMQRLAHFLKNHSGKSIL